MNLGSTVSSVIPPSPPLWLAFGRTLRHDFRAVARVTLACTVVAIVLSLIWPKTYTATAAFVGETPSDVNAASRLGALVASTGLLGAAADEQSPYFYASLLTSREVLETVLLRAVGRAHPTGDSGQVLLDYLKVRGEGRRRIDEGVKLMRKRVSTDVTERTGTVRLWVDDRSPAVAAAVVQALLDELNAFNIARRHSRAAREEEFVQTQLAQARAGLDSSRATLTAFYQTNRIVEAPALKSREQQLNHDLGLRQTQVADLEQAAFQAGLDRVRTTPSITILEHPVPPSRKSKPKRTLIVALTLVLSGLLTVTYRTRHQDLANVWQRLGEPSA